MIIKIALVSNGCATGTMIALTLVTKELVPTVLTRRAARRMGFGVNQARFVSAWSINVMVRKIALTAVMKKVNTSI